MNTHSHPQISPPDPFDDTDELVQELRNIAGRQEDGGDAYFIREAAAHIVAQQREIERLMQAAQQAAEVQS